MAAVFVGSDAGELTPSARLVPIVSGCTPMILHDDGMALGDFLGRFSGEFSRGFFVRLPP
jgi:hypothetical protein